MTKKYYTYANIIRVLALDTENMANSLMVDINTEDGSILTIFDASREFDADFIRSYVNLVSNSTTGFKETDLVEIKRVADDILVKKNIELT